MKIDLRTFFTITLVMLVVFFMTMFSGTAKAVLNDYDKNLYADDDGFYISLESGDAAESGDARDVEITEDDEENYLIYVGNDEGTADMAAQWCGYRGIKYLQMTDIPGADELTVKPLFLMTDGDTLDEDSVGKIKELAAGGVDIILSGTPSDELLTSDEELSELLGVINIRAESVELENIWLYEDFMLGGESYYAADETGDADADKLMDLDTKVEWYGLSAGVTRIMGASVDEDVYEEVMSHESAISTADEDEKYSDAQKYENEYMPPLVWVKLNAANRVFVVNGDYMKSAVGMGFLSGMEYTVSSYQLYPVVNAQVLAYTNFASVTPENTDVMMEKYSRDYLVVERDLIWTGIASIVNYNNGYPSCFFTTNIDNNISPDPDSDFFDYFFRLIRETEGEGGIMVAQYNDTDLTSKLSGIKDLFDDILPDYRVNSAYIGDIDVSHALSAIRQAGFDTVSTLLSSYDEKKGFVYSAGDDTVGFAVVNNGTSHTHSEDMLKTAMETTLGYSAISTDLSCVAYPKDEDDEWQNVYRKLSGYTNTYWKAFKVFDDTSISEAGARVRAFLTMTYEESIEDNVITLDVDTKGEHAYFILRTHNQDIESIDGGSYAEIEDDAYLITTSSDKVYITLKDVNSGFGFF